MDLTGSRGIPYAQMIERCPQCARPVQEGAASCATCGYPLAGDPAGVRDARQNPADHPTERVPLVAVGDPAADQTQRVAYRPQERPAAAPRGRRDGPLLPVWALALLLLALLSVGAWYFVFGRGSDPAAAPPTAASATPTASASASASPTPSPSPSTYEVQAGDTLSVIAQRFGTTTAALAAANEISDPNRITLGQVLVIPPETSTVTPSVSASPSPGG